MPWITPIVDRTSQDVESLKRLMNYINQLGWSNVDQSTRDSWLSAQKGALNANDLNRIDENIKYVKDSLSVVGIDVDIDTSNPNWTTGAYVLLENITIIRDNINALKTAWYVWQSTPSVNYTLSLDYNDANSLELNLLAMKEIFDLWGINIRPICGNINCGQGIIL